MNASRFSLQRVSSGWHGVLLGMKNTAAASCFMSSSLSSRNS